VSLDNLLSKRYLELMRKDPASATRAASDSRAPRLRSAVTNGRRLHVVPPGDTRWARRFRDVLGEIVSDLGGADQLSEGQRQLARRSATIALECEKLEAKAVSGEDIDLDLYGQLTDRLGRTFGRLGLKRVARDVTPSLAEYITQTYGDRDEETAADRPPEAGEGLNLEPGDYAPATGTLPSDPRRTGSEGPP